MRKEELRKLRALPATKEMMEKGKHFHEVTERVWYTSETRKKIVPDYNVLLRVQNLSGYIKMAIFLPEKMRENIKTPRYEVFLNIVGGEYITRELDDDGNEVRWLTSMICNLPDMDYDWYSYQVERKVFLNRDGLRTLNGIPLDNEGSSPEGLRRVRCWQQEQKDKIYKLR